MLASLSSDLIIETSRTLIYLRSCLKFFITYGIEMSYEKSIEDVRASIFCIVNFVSKELIFSSLILLLIYSKFYYIFYFP
jgi:hypothetical protein